MLSDLNKALLKADRLDQMLNQLNLLQIIKENTRVTPKSKTLIDVIITNNKDRVLHAETSLSNMTESQTSEAAMQPGDVFSYLTSCPSYRHFSRRNNHRRSKCKCLCAKRCLFWNSNWNN